MGLFDRRKDDTPSAPSTSEEPVAAAPPAPPDPPAAESAPEPVAAPAPPAVPAADTTSPSGPAIHTVEAGESLANLARRYGVPAEEIARQNHVPPPGQIHPGQVLVIRS